MKDFFENTDLNINSWLVTWGFMNGYLKDGQIRSNKYASFYQLMVVLITLINNIRFIILLLNPKESKITLELGDWSYFIGPRIVINSVCFLCCSYVLITMAFFQFCNRKEKKMLYWLRIMDYDNENRCFYRLNLNESDSEMFIKRSLILINVFKWFSVTFLTAFIIVNCISVPMYLNDYYIEHFIAILFFSISHYQCANYYLGLPVILYLVFSCKH